VNRWGLAELHGQLYEWCEDTWHPNPLGQGHPQDGAPWREEDAELVRLGSGQRRWKLLRGGSWLNIPRNCRSACRFPLEPGNASTSSGSVWSASPRALPSTLNPLIPQHWLFLNPGCSAVGLLGMAPKAPRSSFAD